MRDWVTQMFRGQQNTQGRLCVRAWTPGEGLCPGGCQATREGSANDSPRVGVARRCEVCRRRWELELACAAAGARLQSRGQGAGSLSSSFFMLSLGLPLGRS